MARKTKPTGIDVVEMNQTAYEEEAELENLTVAKTEQSGYNKSRGLRLIFPARVRMNGSATGKPYEWAKPGDIVSVDESDLDDLLSREIGGQGGCCGSSVGRSKLFEIVY